MRKPTKGKTKWSLLASILGGIESLVKVLEHGCLEYGLDSWKQENPDVYLDAAWRHLVAFTRGELTDTKSGVSHLSHVAVNCLFILQADINSKKSCNCAGVIFGTHAWYCNETKNSERAKRRGTTETVLSGSSVDRTAQSDENRVQLRTEDLREPRETPAQERLAEKRVDYRCHNCGKPVGHVKEHRNFDGHGFISYRCR